MLFLGFPATLHWTRQRVRPSVKSRTGVADPQGDETVACKSRRDD
jgi:hypothetical protein